MNRLALTLMIIRLLAATLVDADDSLPPLQVGPFVDPEECYPVLYEADTNGDRQIDADEYVLVVEAFGYDGPPPEDFNDLPPVLRATFRSLACLCQATQGNGCCVGDNAHISNLGTAPDETPTEEQTSYLFTVCQTTVRAVEQANASIPPSKAPTMSPTAEPTMFLTLVPTDVPTGNPTVSPTDRPTLFPTDVPTGIPTISPTDSPTSSPTGFPTSAPTDTPTSGPTGAASPSPTVFPTPEPGAPTIAPTTAEPNATTSPTSLAPTTSPSEVPLVPVSTSYSISVTDGKAIPLADNEVSLLVGAMDILAPQVAQETFPDSSRRLRRRLVVRVSLPTTVTGFIPEDCPAGTVDTTSCQNTAASISLVVIDENEDEVSASYLTALDTAIDEGRLGAALKSLDENSRMTVLAPTAPVPTAAPAGDDSGLSSGATAGIAVAAVVGVLAAAGLYVMRRRSSPKEDPFASQQALSTQESTGRGASAAAASQLGASEADYGKRAKKTSVTAFDSLEAGEGEVGVESAESSSNAGSSGWSSSAGVSSLNTGSADDSLDYGSGGGGGAGVAIAGGATLAALGAASAMSRDKNGEDEPPGLPRVNRDDLDAAIEAGDWAAVGATAALLAAGSDSQSQSSRSRRSTTTGSSKGGSTVSSIDAERAAELDHLVDAGDWEGVVLAAAKFEAAEDDASRSGGSSRSQSGSRGSTVGSTGQGSSANSASETSESASKVAKRAEIRAEVESLVRRVVPEEIDNVDEMMTQFKGREEELVETLRTMQERAVAQKARVAGQKTAKREARLSAKQGGGPPAAPSAAAAATAAPAVPPPSTGDTALSPAAAAGVSAGVAAALGVAAGIAAGSKKREEASQGSGSSPGSASSPSLSTSQSSSRPSGGGKRRRTALELAIEAGDWEAVGEAAAMMSDASHTTEDSGDLSNLPGSDERVAEARRMAESGVNAERAKELDDMIDRGDWTGVVAAASRFSKADVESTTEASSQHTPGTGSATAKVSDTDSYGSLDKDKALKEEQDALAQAEIWMAIAEQSKTEGSTDMAASNAADWAIARSLSALRNAEERGDLKQKASKKEPGSSDSVGDGSV